MEEQQKIENLCARVRSDCNAVAKVAKDVMINKKEIQSFCGKFDKVTYVAWKDCHFDHKELSIEQLLGFIFVIDSLNFCFWPTDKFEYDDMVRNLKMLLDEKGEFFTAKSLAKLQESDWQFVKAKIFGNNQFALLKERTMILKDVGSVIQQSFDGSFTKFVSSCNNSAVKVSKFKQLKSQIQLVNSIFTNFQGFKDKIQISQITQLPSSQHLQNFLTSSLYFLKRAQILTADIFAALSERQDSNELQQIKGSTSNQLHIQLFPDIHELTMFPDYRVPQILRSLGILQYSEDLAKIVDDKIEIKKGSWKQVQIRAQTVEAVERIKLCFKQSRNVVVSSIELDWYLWQEGQKKLSQIEPHHRTLTMFY